MKKYFLTIFLFVFFAIIVSAKNYEVVKGDTLWKISNVFYKNPFLWKKIFDFNIDKIKNPNLIYPGQVFAIPELSSGNNDSTSRKEVLETAAEEAGVEKEQQAISQTQDINEKNLLEQTDLKNNEPYDEINTEKEIIFEETALLGKIVRNNNKLFYTDGDTLYFSLLENITISDGDVFYIFHKGPSKYDISLQNVKKGELIMVGKGRVKNISGNFVELYIIRAYSPIIEGDLVFK